MCIARDRSYTFHSEVEQFCWEPRLLEERYDEAAEATVDMEANVVVLSNCPESNDVVHSTIGEIDGGSNDLESV